MSRLLLDTNALIWVLEDAGRLSSEAEGALNDAAAEKLVSIASFWEITIKVALRKLALAEAPEMILDRFEAEGIATIVIRSTA